MKKITHALIAVVLISSFPLTSSAMALRCGWGMRMGGFGYGLRPGACWPFWIPNLTSEQSAKLTELQKNVIEEISKLRSELAVKRIELNQLLAQLHPNPEEVIAKQKELSHLQSQLQQKCVSDQLEMRKILTEEQLSQIPYGYGFNANPFSNYSPGWMRGYGPPHGQSFAPGRGGACGNRWGCRPWW